MALWHEVIFKNNSRAFILMKNISYLFLALILAFVTACGVTPDIQPVPEDLTLPLADGKMDITFTDAALNVATPSVVAASGDAVNVSLVIKKTPESDKPRIMRVFVTDKPNYRGKGDLPLFEVKLKNKDEQTQTIEYTVSPASGKVYIHFDVYDNKEKVTRKTLIVNISADGQIASWPNVVLGGQINAAGSRVASATGDVYKVCDIDSNMKFIDVTYAVVGSPTSKPTFMSNPRRAGLGLGIVVPTTNVDCGGTSTGGGTATYFTAAPATVDFTAATDAIMGALMIPATSQDIAVEVGKVYAFQNARNKKGLLRVTAIEPGTGGKITFDIKVQK
jgi:hypothetical protein